MSNADTPVVAAPSRKPEERLQRGVFYDHNYYTDSAGRFFGEDKAGSNKFLVFPSQEVYEEAVREYNIVGRIPVKAAAIGPA